MKRIFNRKRAFGLLSAGGFAAALIAGPAAALAGQNWSDENLAYTRGFIAQSIDMLQHDARDYGGHRAAAVNDLGSVQADLNAALRYDGNHDRFADRRIIVPSQTQSWQRGQGASNQNIEAVDAYLQSAANALEQDQHDYDGFRVKAIAGIEAARAQLRQAIAYSNQNGTDSRSDRNMQYARWYIERGIDQLQTDRHDYAGHREGAVDAMQQARQDLLLGLRADASDPRAAAIAPPNGEGARLFMRSQNGSNQNLEYVRSMIRNAVTMLGRDSRDYDGYRVKAIDQLQIADGQIDAALGSVSQNRIL